MGNATDYCKGTPCGLHTLHRFTYVVLEHDGEANTHAVVACSMAHASENAGEPGVSWEEAEESSDSDELAYCRACEVTS